MSPIDPGVRRGTNGGSEHAPAAGPPADELLEDRLYEEYLDAALSGRLEPPELFCARHGVESGALRERLLALHRLIEQRVAGAAHSADDAPFAAPRVAPLVADDGMPWPKLGEFRLLRRLGEGGMGVVYLAQQESLGRLVALKVIRPELAASASASERFRREAKAVARLHHPNIVGIHAFGEEQGVLWCALELAPGRSLAQILEEARNSGAAPAIPDVLRWIEPIARALDAAHEQGILHRDVKPSNVRIAPDGRPLLVDFGIARDLSSDAPTLTRQFTGSPAYASPEQVANCPGGLDRRTDVYSLGITLYECLTLAIPFADESLERTFQQILHADPPPIRRLRPAIPRDLETVVQKSIEKEPERRYARAAELADDLLAVLELRPVRARPPGPGALVRRWVVGHRAAAAAIGALLVALLSFATFFGVQEARQRAARAREAAGLVGDAGKLLSSYVSKRAELAQVAASIARLERDVETNYVPPERATLLDRKGEVERMDHDRTVVAQQIEQLLLQAERLDPAVAGVERLRADLYLEQLREAREKRDFPRVAFATELVRQHDREGRHADELRSRVPLTITTDPPGAELHLFRLRFLDELVPGGEHRYVPVPVGAAPSPVAPGSIVLRVVVAAGDLRTNDLIVQLAGRPIAGSLFVTRGSERVLAFDRLVRVDGHEVRERFDVDLALARGAAPHAFEFEASNGSRTTLSGASLAAIGIEVGDAAAAAEVSGAPAVVCSDGKLRECELPEGLRVRATAAPLLISAASRVGTTPFHGDVAGWDVHVALLRLPGHEDQRLVIHAMDGRRPPEVIPLLPEGTSPPEMVHVAAPFENRSPYWILDREVTAGEYLEFLNDPVTQRRIGNGRSLPLVPRTSAAAPATGSWPRNTDGSFRLADDFDPRWPVIGITWNDAQEYVAWKNRVSGIESRALRYSLPTLEEWRNSAHGRLSLYIYGETFRPTWFKSCYARAIANPERVLSFPIDESDMGVFDLTGSASEWCDSPLDDPSKGFKAAAGGNWGTGDPIAFRAEAAFPAPPEIGSGVIGMRLVCRRIEEKQ